MGHSYTFDGEITIVPPLNYAQIQQARKIAMGSLRPGFDSKHATETTVFDGYMPLKPRIIEQEKSTAEGVMRVIQATHLVPSHGSDGSLSYDMADLATALTKAFPEHQFHGTVVALRQDGMSAVKLTVQGTRKGPSQVSKTEGDTYIHWNDQSDSTPVSDLL